MAQLNETFLGHSGATDVITFNHGEPESPREIHGEIFICLQQTVAQASALNLPWTEELVRYMVHGLLHLQGWDDHTSDQRRKMRHAESRWLAVLQKEFSLAKLDRSEG